MTNLEGIYYTKKICIKEELIKLSLESQILCKESVLICSGSNKNIDIMLAN